MKILRAEETKALLAGEPRGAAWLAAHTWWDLQVLDAVIMRSFLQAKGRRRQQDRDVLNVLADLVAVELDRRG